MHSGKYADFRSPDRWAYQGCAPAYQLAQCMDSPVRFLTGEPRNCANRYAGARLRHDHLSWDLFFPLCSRKPGDPFGFYLLLISMFVCSSLGCGRGADIRIPGAEKECYVRSCAACASAADFEEPSQDEYGAVLRFPVCCRRALLGLV